MQQLTNFNLQGIGVPFILGSTDVSLLDLPLLPLLSPAPLECTEAASDLNIVPPPLRPKLDQIKGQV